MDVTSGYRVAAVSLFIDYINSYFGVWVGWGLGSDGCKKLIYEVEYVSDALKYQNTGEKIVVVIIYRKLRHTIDSRYFSACCIYLLIMCCSRHIIVAENKSHSPALHKYM